MPSLNWCHLIDFWCHLINFWRHLIIFWCHDLNWCQLINFWCHFINFWGHVLLTISQKMSTFSLSHLMARVVMITRRRSAIFSMMGHTEQIWEEQIGSSLRRSLDHCVLHQRSHNVEGLGESILRKIQSQGRNLGSLSMNYFGAQKIRGELLPEEFRQKWSILHFFGTHPLNQRIFNWQSIGGERLANMKQLNVN